MPRKRSFSSQCYYGAPFTTTYGLIPLKCPSCGGDIQIDDTKEFAFCMFCGTKMVIQEQLSKRVVIDDSAKINGLLNNARHFYDQKAYADARLFVILVSLAKYISSSE
ncbi:MAG: hypothetical protein E7Z62_05295 [Thermoplasmata archaeon]|nr:hypothetical protein [Thermoplasmata archaeon]